MIGYRLPAAPSPMDAAEHPSMRRLLPAGPWQYAPHPQGGTLATWRDPAGRAVGIDAFGPPRETADGLTYYPAKVLPTLADLVRKNAPASLPVDLASGVRVPIAIAIASPRKLVFNPSGVTEGDWLTEYARLADQVREKTKTDGDVMRDDPLLGRTVMLAFQQCLRVTEELLTDLGWVSTNDFLPILMAAWGHDPGKAIGTDAGQSPSPVPG